MSMQPRNFVIAGAIAGGGLLSDLRGWVAGLLLLVGHIKNKKIDSTCTPSARNTPPDSQHKLSISKITGTNTSNKQMSLSSSMGATRLAPHLDRLISPQTRQRVTEQLTQFARERPYLAVQPPPRIRAG